MITVNYVFELTDEEKKQLENNEILLNDTGGWEKGEVVHEWLITKKGYEIYVHFTVHIYDARDAWCIIAMTEKEYKERCRGNTNEYIIDTDEELNYYERHGRSI